MDLSQFGVIGALATSAAWLVQLIVSGLTLAQPGRPSWLPWLASVLLGIVFVALLALATGALDGTLPWPQLAAQVVIVGIVAGGGAGGANAAAAAAERKRQAVRP
jgi:hypothetical protein